MKAPVHRDISSDPNVAASAGQTGKRTRSESESQQLDMADMLNSIDEYFFSVDQNWNITFANDCLLRRLGKSKDEVVGKHVRELTPAGLFEKLPGEFEKVAHERSSTSSEVYHELTRTWYEVHVFPIKGGIGTRILNISDRKKAQEIQIRLAAIVESSDDAIVSKDLNGIVQSWNRGAERIFGYSAEEMVGNPISVIAAPDRINEMPEILRRVCSGERIDHYETKRRRKDGVIIDISLTVSPILDPSGRIIGASKIARDISERKRMDAALRATNVALSRANADLQQFAYSASHDLREPIRMISIYSQLLKKNYGEKLDERANEYLRYSIEGARRMEQLVKDLLEYTRATVSDAEPPLTDANVALQNVLPQFGPIIEANQASVTSDTLPKIRMHSVHLEQLFQNIISNALKYRREESPRIHVSAGKVRTEWIVSLQDNGIGIDQRYAEQIFGLFRRLHTTEEYAGTGVGLAICRNIIERYGGRIWVTSKPGEGSTFFFSIPDRADAVA